MPKTTDKNKYFVVRERAVPEVLLNVVAAKKLLESKRVATVQEAADAVGISRSSFYKYKDDIFPFHEEAKGKTITFIIQMDDEPGIRRKWTSLPEQFWKERDSWKCCKKNSARQILEQKTMGQPAGRPEPIVF